MKHGRLLATSVMFATLTLTACGGSSTVEPAPTTSSQASVPTAQPPTAAPVEDTTQPEATADASEQTTTDSASPAVTTPDGWTAHTVAATDLQLALPASWEQLEMDEKQLDTTIDTLKETNPQLAEMMGGQARALMQQGIKFFAFDNNEEISKHGFATNANVIAQALPVEMSVDEIAEANMDQIQQLPGATKPETQKLTLSDGSDAMQAKYNFDVANAEGKAMKAAITQYFTVKNSTLYIVTLTTTDDQTATYEPIFSQIAQTFTFTK